ncbi:MAG: hypothetical protein ACE5Q6_15615 [Dehalococcoidia bacterium]
MLKVQQLQNEAPAEFLASNLEAIEAQASVTGVVLMPLNLEEQLVAAKAHRNQAETQVTRVTNEVLLETEQIYKRLIASGEEALEASLRLEAEAASKLGEAQEALAQAQAARAEAGDYCGQLRAEALEQAEEIVADARAAAEAEAQILRQQAAQEAQQILEQANSLKAAAQEQLEQARASWAETDSCCEQLLADTVQQAEEIISCTYRVVEDALGKFDQQPALDAEPSLEPAAVAPLVESEKIFEQIARIEATFDMALGHTRRWWSRLVRGDGLKMMVPVPVEAIISRIPIRR